jgi:hypothetical protein
MSGLLFWVVACVLFLMAVACAVIGRLVRRHERPYLHWAVLGLWAMLCLALGWILWAGFS